MAESCRDSIDEIRKLLKKRLASKARENALVALERFPTHPKLIELANEACRVLGDHRNSLEYADKLVICDALNWHSYQKAAQACMAIHDYAGASKRVGQGLERMPQHQNLIGLESIISESARLYHEKDILFHCWHHVMYSPVGPLPQIKRDTSFNARLDPIQYWSQEAQPAQIRDITNAWNSILSVLGIQPIRVWNKLDAEAWIGQFAPQFLNAFQSAPHYASESDVFRLAYAASRGCIWFDSDIYPKSQSIEILSMALSCTSTVLSLRFWGPYIESDFFVASSGCPFFAHCAHRMEDYSFDSGLASPATIHNTFGPQLYNNGFREMFGHSPHAVELVAPGYLHRAVSGDFSVVLCNKREFAHTKKPGLCYGASYLDWRDV